MAEMSNTAGFLEAASQLADNPSSDHGDSSAPGSDVTHTDASLPGSDAGDEGNSASSDLAPETEDRSAPAKSKGKKGEGWIPKTRFDEVNTEKRQLRDEMAVLRHRIAEFEKNTQRQTETDAGQQSGEKSWLDSFLEGDDAPAADDPIAAEVKSLKEWKYDLEIKERAAKLDADMASAAKQYERVPGFDRDEYENFVSHAIIANPKNSDIPKLAEAYVSWLKRVQARFGVQPAKTEGARPNGGAQAPPRPASTQTPAQHPAQRDEGYVSQADIIRKLEEAARG